MIEMYLGLILFGALMFGGGVLYGWFLREKGLDGYHRLVMKLIEDHQDEASSARVERENLALASRTERERLMREIATMRKAGFNTTYSEEPVEDTYVMNDEYEAEVAAQRRRQSQAEPDARDGNADLIGELGSSLHTRS